MARITIELSEAEVLALDSVIGEGLGMLADAAASKAYIGDKRAREAAVSGAQKISYAAVDVRAWRETRKRLKGK